MTDGYTMVGLALIVLGLGIGVFLTIRSFEEVTRYVVPFTAWLAQIRDRLRGRLSDLSADGERRGVGQTVSVHYGVADHPRLGHVIFAVKPDRDTEGEGWAVLVGYTTYSASEFLPVRSFLLRPTVQTGHLTAQEQAVLE